MLYAKNGRAREVVLLPKLPITALRGMVEPPRPAATLDEMTGLRHRVLPIRQEKHPCDRFGTGKSIA